MYHAFCESKTSSSEKNDMAVAIIMRVRLRCNASQVRNLPWRAQFVD